MSEELKNQLAPQKRIPVYDLLRGIDFNVSAWSINANNESINPYENSYRNSQWAFGGPGQPTVIFLWHGSIDWDNDDVEFIGSTSSQELIDRLNSRTVSSRERRVFRVRINKNGSQREFLYRAYRSKSPIRVVLVSGKEVDFDFAEESSKASARLMDPAEWYVHVFDGETGRYRLVRDKVPTENAPNNNDGDLVDPVDDPVFQRFLGALSETEREALIKVRVDQGTFRARLIERWQGCAVTGCKKISYLIAGHIKPWSRCGTRDERLTASNGLLLIPNLDKAFDRGGITFDESLRIVISSSVTVAEQRDLQINRNTKLLTDDGEDLKPFLRWHQQHIYEHWLGATAG